MKKTVEVLSGHYPETMHKTCIISRHRPLGDETRVRDMSETCPYRYIINGPLIVRAAWNVTRQHATLDAEVRVPVVLHVALEQTPLSLHRWIRLPDSPILMAPQPLGT